MLTVTVTITITVNDGNGDDNGNCNGNCNGNDDNDNDNATADDSDGGINATYQFVGLDPVSKYFTISVSLFPGKALIFLHLQKTDHWLKN